MSTATDDARYLAVASLYWTEKCAKALRDLDKLREERDTLAAELAELRLLALQVEHAASVEAMQMGAMALIARLCRPHAATRDAGMPPCERPAVGP